MTVTQSLPPDALDRVAPTVRPAGKRAMFQNWADLLFLHWVVPAQRIIPLLPPGLTLDTFEGRAYVGLVPFTMTGVRPIWMPPFPPLTDFHETNVRTYVHRDGRDPGVWFFSLDAANAVAVQVARAVWKLPYHFARMSLMKSRVTVLAADDHAEDPVKPNDGSQSPAAINRTSTSYGPYGMELPPLTDGDIHVNYSTHRQWPAPVPASCTVRYTVGGPVSPAEVGTLEHFLAERYYLYTYARRRLLRAQVHHSPYPLQRAVVHALLENMVAAAGIERPDEPPLAHYASGVTVDIYPLRRIST